MKRKKIVVRIKGGLGNQMFCYAMARRLAIFNSAELVIDHISGFKNDKYQRKYSLNVFNIDSCKVGINDRLWPFERVRRLLKGKKNAKMPFSERDYFEQEFIQFDSRFIDLKITNDIHIDGLWQSYKYFEDISEVIKNDFIIKAPLDTDVLAYAAQIEQTNSVALHFRWFDSPDKESVIYNVENAYYNRAIKELESLVKDELTYFVFSDNAELFKKYIKLPVAKFIIVETKKEDDKAYQDIWLMSQCKYIITANSTFSWWAAWLNNNDKKIVLTPDYYNDEGKCGWGFEGLIPDSWIKIKSA